MKNQKFKPKKIIDGYQMKKHLHDGFHIVEYWHYENETNVRKRNVAKHLNLSDAENLLYKLESKNN